ncbi:MAG: hypothetical protein RL094_483 [Candidatus Parcubacteria bacterium]|jgi:hypothetical protein
MTESHSEQPTLEEVLLEHFDELKEYIEALPEGGSIISSIQDTVVYIANNLREHLNLRPLDSAEFSALACAGFTDKSNDAGDPLVSSYLTGEETIIGYTVGGPQGRFVADQTGLQQVLSYLCTIA